MQKIFQHITHYKPPLYVVALMLLALTYSAIYLVLINDLRKQEGRALLIKVSAEQGQVIKNINFLFLQKSHTIDTNQIQSLDSKIASNITQLDATHASLRRGIRFVRDGQRLIDIDGELPAELKLLYFDGEKSLDSLMQSYLLTAHTLLNISAAELELSPTETDNLFFGITPELLKTINRASLLQQQQSDIMLDAVITKQRISFVISLLSLVLIGWLLRHIIFKSQEKTALSKQDADNIINITPAFIIGLDAEANIVLFNQYAQENTGWSENEIKGTNFFQQCIPEEDRFALRTLFNKMMSETLKFGEEIETQMRIVTGELIDVAWNPTVLKNADAKRPTLFLATGIDITDRKIAERKVQKVNIELAELGQRLQNEINLAAALQRSILPSPDIYLPGLQGQANLLTSSEVGGDYYDYYNIDGFHNIILIGDVSGHGVAAGTLVSAAKAGVYPLISNKITSPDKILSALNKTILATAQQSLLMTMACLSLDARSGKLTFANAGHVLPYLLRHHSRQWEMLEASGLPLGKSLDADYFTAVTELSLNIGDKLFLYTDGLLEEESPDGEAFGYDRLEAILNNNLTADPETLHHKLLDALRIHCRGVAYQDDVTIMVIAHTDRVIQTHRIQNEISDIIRISEHAYRQNEQPMPRVSKEYVVFIAEQGYVDLLPRFNQDGICRILPRYNNVCKQLGWDHLLNQHRESFNDDLYALIPGEINARQFYLTHTDDKLFIMAEIQSWLTDQKHIHNDNIEALVVILDEMTENSLYAAPCDGKGIPYYNKGESRALSEHEEVRIDIALTENFLGLMITDNWGTLTPSVFLKNLTRAMDSGVEAGVGGAGLYLMWRLSDYLQIRVHPQKHTQVTTLWELHHTVEMTVDSGIQFIYHSGHEAA